MRCARSEAVIPTVERALVAAHCLEVAGTTEDTAETRHGRRSV